ncbi:putative membrane protein [Bacteroides fragilis str. S6L8]|jgi:uncharacterized integral membrane protein|uniref:hypothetical protein n=1 Tax=Bacteroides fragilis TaxID=817 RepID=UPI00044D2D7C|nr:hypothetical protein [Bacteroides fragilis]EYE45558.1 putative membrane protein [Bacteroides fragilis str. S6L5]EYA03583.1 putative membrane protein [Bacteroides fragilis str. S6L3]EYA08340.1 putative membrane protein [Bacteroides fragilis str. S6R6]EYA99294.1 putative membrane protein [Bacteroides fragilis str. S6L8]EYB03922.1 putative membrane protein [Bacteroides fragilis str. S6R5]
MKQNIYKWGLPVAVGICLILTILKMCGLIAIEWAYVFAPIWMPIVLVFLLVVIYNTIKNNHQ